MVGSVIAALLISCQGTPSPGRYEIGERIKDLDQAWASTPDRARKSAAIPKILAAFQGTSSSETCRSLDEATAALRGRPLTAGDAIDLRFDPPFVEPRTPAKLRITWSYIPSKAETVRITVGRQSVMAAPGRALTVEVRPEALNPDILQNPEVGFLAPIQVGAEQRSVFLSIVKHPRERLAALKNTKSPEARTLYDFLQTAFDDPDSLESDCPLIQYLFTAELLDEGRLRLDRADGLPLVRSGDTYFRAAFPRTSMKSLNVVIALHGAGGSENSFFDACGRGGMATEALKRGWAFIAPRNSPNEIKDVLDWLKTRRKQPIGRVFVIAHGEGAGGAMLPGLKLSAVALLAPVPASFSDFGGAPLYVGVGKEDSLAGAIKAEAGRKSCDFQEFEACERYTIVAEASPSVFRFFDAQNGR